MERRSACHRWRSGLMALLLVAPWPVTGVSQRGASPPPAELSALVAKARVEGAIAAWCRGELRAGRSGGFAVALSASRGGGRYMALDADGTVTELAAYTGSAEVSCYSRAEARRLNDTIRQSQTIHGEVTPRWNTAVVCAFVEETSAVCWQHSPDGRTFVKVGGWVT